MKVLRVDTDERKIGLCRKRVEWSEEDGAEAPPDAPTKPTKPAVELKGGVGSAGPLIQTPAAKKE